MEEHNINDLLRDLFDRARSNGKLDYIFTLVRVTGMSFHRTDPILDIRSILESVKEGSPVNDMLEKYCHISSCEDYYQLIVNLIRCAKGLDYMTSPFQHLYTGDIVNLKRPSPKQIVDGVIDLAIKHHEDSLAQTVRIVYSDDFLSRCPSLNTEGIDLDRLKSDFRLLRNFVTIFLNIYYEERLKFITQPKYYKLPQFEVLELLTDEKSGLYGFHIHFSNGTRARFARHIDSTECINIYLRDPINFMAGNLDELTDVWIVGDKKLYEIGLPGRYNMPGEWKPIIYPGKCDQLEKDAKSLSDDPEIQGSLFYIMCTCHHVVEFVVTSTIEFPQKHFSIGDNIHFIKCSPTDEMPESNSNLFIYDGWIDLRAIDPAYIESAISAIGIVTNRVAFAYDATVFWRLKYNTLSPGAGYATPTVDDLELFNSLQAKYPDGESTYVLDYSIDWYNRGRAANNLFVSYMCYYISMETLAISLSDKTLTSKSTAEKKKSRKDCIHEKYYKLYSNDPIRFVREAYFECVESLTVKVRNAIKKVFGDDHQYIGLLFDKKDGYSLSELRHEIAHGKMSFIDRGHEKIVGARIHEMARISREFIFRIIFSLKPEDPLPKWSGSHKMKMSFNDPRTVLVSSTEKIFPKETDWKIKVEWCMPD